MTGGELSGDKATGGGGVSANTFTMSGGKISGTEATSSDGGWVSANTFTMAGGVRIANNLSKTNGIIYGNETSLESALKNTATGLNSQYGHAVSACYAGSLKHRDSTAYADHEMSVIEQYDGGIEPVLGSYAGFDY
jgi:hypothetical protein